ncbi:hypothetical protein CK203_071917 [Vitis vinifera]|uniref:Uncharacterized protein n=1 Tax=Vitis vinifera TaxID=29760 RepID=A0A438F3Y7_VITVI|nr:hypothetical protein CK203_071917 [Vitis vinifera]
MSQVEGKHGSFWCFYLSENLNENRDYILRAQKDDEEGDMFNLPQALPEALGHHCGNFLILGGPLNLYNGQNLCLHFGMTTDGFKDQCINPEGFASFLGLLESIPFHNSDSNYGSFEYAMPDSRYIFLLLYTINDL